MHGTRLLFTAGLLIGLLTQSLRAPAVDLRGTLQGAEALTPSPRQDPPRYRAAYWEVANGVLPITTARANVEWDVGVVLTGQGVAESTQPVRVRVEGGRCRPGTVVVSPGTVFQLENLDILAHEFYAVRPGQAERVAPAELTATRSHRQIIFQAAGTYEIRDARQPSFRCWAVVGPGQGRVLLTNREGAFAAQGIPDGDYTVKAYFEGAERATGTISIRGRDEQMQLALGSGGAPAAPGAAGANGAAPNAPAADAGAAPNAATNEREGRSGRRRRDDRDDR